MTRIPHSVPFRAPWRTVLRKPLRVLAVLGLGAALLGAPIAAIAFAASRAAHPAATAPVSTSTSTPTPTPTPAPVAAARADREPNVPPSNVPPSSGGR